MQSVADDLGLVFVPSLGWTGSIGGIDVLLRQQGDLVHAICRSPVPHFRVLRAGDRAGLLAPNVRTGHAGLDDTFHITADDPQRFADALDDLFCAALEDNEAIHAIQGFGDQLTARLTIDDDHDLTGAVMVLVSLCHRLVPSVRAA